MSVSEQDREAGDMNGMKPIASLRELRKLSHSDPRYEQLTILASCRLGGSKELPLHDHHEWLRIYSMATSEQDIVEQINCCIPQVEA